MKCPPVHVMLRFKFRYVCLFAACLSAFPFASFLHAQDAATPDVPGKDTQEKVQVDDLTRNFTLHLPTGYGSQKRYPVVVLFHGRNQDADDMERITHFNQLADKDGIIAVYPVASRGEWNIGVHAEQPASGMQRRGGGRHGGWGGGGAGYPGGGGYPGGRNGSQNPDDSKPRPEPADDIGFLNQLLDQMALKYSLDNHRIYATGLGEGGFMAERVACSLSDRVAAVAAVAANFPKTMICLPSRAVPILFIDGTDDPIVPYNGGTYKPRRFPVLSAEDSAKTWAKFDRCAEKPAQGKIPPLAKDSKETKTFTYSGCQNNAQVVLDSVKDGGNTWPGGQPFTTEKEVGKTSAALDANQSVWNFLSVEKTPDNGGAQK